MKLQMILVGVWSTLHLASVEAYNPFEGFFKLSGACFPVADVPSDCDRTAQDNFTYLTPRRGDNAPETLVYLFTPDSPETAEPLHKCGGRLPTNTRYDPDVDTEVILHGFVEGMCRSAWMREIKEQLFLKGKYNVILVDWTWGNGFDYYRAVENCPTVGEQVGFVINNIMRQTGVGPEKFHVTGHSLGANVAGFVGRRAKGLRRITGLDPAHPGYQDVSPDKRLTYRDAQLVDIIHTNGGNCLSFGDRRQLGHADFYVNGAVFQPSCYIYLLKSILKGDIYYALLSLEPTICSHLQAIQFYKVSIMGNGCEFVGIASASDKRFKKRTPRIRRSNWAVMGMDYELYRKKSKSNRNTKRTRYYLSTRNICPYYDDSYLKGKALPFDTSCTA